jgi:VanZ family protein
LLTPSFRTLARRWWPVALWLLIIRLESTDMASASNTGGLLHSLLSLIIHNPSQEFLDLLNEVLRKSGHFVGYGILAILVVLALRNTNRDRLAGLLKRPWGGHFSDLWRWNWGVLGVLVAMVTATFDELHQSTMPSRTGRWQDVVLDTCGAVVLQVGLYVWTRRRYRDRRESSCE